MKGLTLFLITLLLFSVQSCTSDNEQNSKQPIGASDNEISFRFYTELKTAVEFWKNIFVKYNIDEIIVHNQDDLSIIYEIIKLPTNKNGNPIAGRTKGIFMKKIIDKYKTAFHHLDIYHQKKIAKLTSFEKNLLDILKTHKITSNYSSLSANFRIQSGLRDSFIQGYVESGKYLPYIRDIFKREGIPLELCYLPHVESAFNKHAVSKCGAVGIWQFMPYTAKAFIEVGDDIDERRDPFMSTYAASQYFKEAYQKLDSWELALISYNYGIQGTKNAVKELNTKDVVTIIKNYQGKSFGFAARNFYAEFLAVKEICENPEKYIPDVEKSDPLEFDVFVLPHYIDWETLIDDLGLPDEELKELNSHINTTAIINGSRRLPKNLKLKVPEGTLENLLVKYQSLPATKLHTTQISYQVYRVRKGDNLSKISEKFDTSINAIKSLNNLRGNKIYANQILKIPV